MTEYSMDCEAVCSGSDDEKWDEASSSPFLGIPEEMFLHICSFLEVKDLVYSLAFVCKRFYEILQNDSMYKSWIASKWGRPYPMVESVSEDSINWKEACFLLEKENKIWSGCQKHMIVRDTHLSNVDAVMFLNGAKHCVTASRDHFMALWDLNEGDDTVPKIVEMKKAHDGWVWRVRQSGEYIYTASWDFTIKEWLWQEGFTEKSCMRSNAPVLCLTLDNNGLIYGGTITKVVQAFDPRTQPAPLFSLEGHRRSVLTLGAVDRDIISGSEDKSLIVWDIRMRKSRQKVNLDESSYPINCEELDKVLYVADNKGMVRSYAFHSGSLNTESSFEVGHSKLVTTVKVTRGAVITAALDGIARCHLTLRPPVRIGSVTTIGGEASGMDYCNGRLVIGTASTVEFWIPKPSQ